MLPFQLETREAEPLRVLCLGAHSDDIEIGCGGTILALTRANPAIEIRWCVFSATADRASEAREAAGAFVADARRAQISVHDFPDGLFPTALPALKAEFEALKTFQPSLILTHYRDDLHQDHRTISELTHNTFRDHAILEYEVPKYDGDWGNPNCFVPLEPEVCERKLAALLRHFGSQQGRSWFTADTFKAVLRLRGIGCRSPTGMAEAFYARKMVWAP